jgi:Peptidase family M1 domain
VSRAALLAAALLLLLPAAGARAGEPDPTAPAYTVDLRGSDGGFRWQGTETITLTNPGSAPLTSIWVRLWGNGPDGCARARAVRMGNVAGAVASRLRLRCTAVELRLAAPLAPGARGSVGFSVDIRVPREEDRFGRGGRGVALLSNAIPALAHLEGGRWRLDRYFGAGETWTYPAADWTVRLRAPRRIRVAAPGTRGPDGALRLEHGRDFSFAAGRLRALRASVAGVAVTAWGDRGAPLRRMLRIVRRRLPRLIRLFGPYGWPELQVVVTDSAAMEHTALVMTPADDYVVTHELAHQWWFASVGDDQAAAPWLDEAFATYAEEAARRQEPWCRRSGKAARRVTRGVSFWRHRIDAYGAAVYLEGACLLDLLERRMGRRTFRTALRRYAIEQRYGWSTAARFRAAMDAVAPRPLDDLWRRYDVR